jgi:hypothetical protein
MLKKGVNMVPVDTSELHSLLHLEVIAISMKL